MIIVVLIRDNGEVCKRSPSKSELWNARSLLMVLSVVPGLTAQSDEFTSAVDTITPAEQDPTSSMMTVSGTTASTTTAPGDSLVPILAPLLTVLVLTVGVLGFFFVRREAAKRRMEADKRSHPFIDALYRALQLPENLKANFWIPFSLYAKYVERMLLGVPETDRRSRARIPQDRCQLFATKLINAISTHLETANVIHYNDSVQQWDFMMAAKFPEAPPSGLRDILSAEQCAELDAIYAAERSARVDPNNARFNYHRGQHHITIEMTDQEAHIPKSNHASEESGSQESTQLRNRSRERGLGDSTEEGSIADPGQANMQSHRRSVLL